MQSTHGIRMRDPVHPGAFVKHEIIEPLDLSIKGTAEALDVTWVALTVVLDERECLSPELASRIEKAFGVSMDTLMRMQKSYDIAKARARSEEIEVSSFEKNVAGRL